ncbi:flavodoxin domain-containing protein [Natronospora cellulosivora (SeqCode)]
MESILLVYNSKTGFTKKYVEWINEKISCNTMSFDQITNGDINNYDIIIYGAGMHASRINGLKGFKKKVLNLSNKKIIVFATGGTPYSEDVFSQIQRDNFSEDELKKIKFFYFQSGLNFEKMGFSDKAIMKTYSWILNMKNNKSEIEEGTSKAITESYDHSNSEYIKPMIDYLNKVHN